MLQLSESIGVISVPPLTLFKLKEAKDSAMSLGGEMEEGGERIVIKVSCPIAGFPTWARTELEQGINFEVDAR